MTKARVPSRKFAEPDIEMERRSDGSVVLRSRQPLGEHEPHLGVMLRRGAEQAPDRTMLAERAPDGGWREVSWAEARRAADGIAQALLDRGLGPERPVMVLSGNSVNHALLMLGCFEAGVPIAPVSAAYSLLSEDFGKLEHVAGLVRPAMIYVESGGPFARALGALDLGGVEVVVGDAPPEGVEARRLSELAETEPGEAARRAFEALGPDDVAKILFTSGSTDVPKGVVNTHRMLCSNQQAIGQCWPFVSERPPVLVDWLPWSHTFGANHNFNLVLRNAGTLYVDGGKPRPGLVELTVDNLREVSPTLYFNVPAGFGMLLPHLEQDAELRERFFAELDLVFYAGAALSQDLWERLEAVAERARGERVVLTSAWGSTETSPLATSAHFELERAGNIGVPAPGTSIKMVPNGNKMEIRVAGPNVTPGYWRQPELTREAFDEEGFYRIGDAGKLADEQDPNRGILFDGRVAEDFKLSTGTWVHCGNLRVAALAAASPVLQDAVVTAPDRDYVGLLGWPNPAACRELLGASADTPVERLLAHPALREHLRTGLAAHNARHDHASMRIGRVLLMAEPPSIDAGEITDKGYINQRAALERRADLVERLYADPPPDDVIVV